MTEQGFLRAGYQFRVISLHTAVIGSGAAGFNAADRLWQYGIRDIAIITEGVRTGTSRNTGSDKQTYYKLSLSGDSSDSVAELAKDLFSGGCVDGDHALSEAALSAQSFLRLVELGVPFPQNRYGEFIGYKTDHDSSCRATSVGPYTSRKMTECIEGAVHAKGIRIFDGFQLVKIFTQEDALLGFLCVDKNAQTLEECFVLFHCSNMVLATGGPAGIYAKSVYPHGHYGATGVAFEAGAKGKNLTEWQFGISSINPRWNVSGSYMQVLPKFVSTDAHGGDQREFLPDYFRDKGEMLSHVFMKGYQWPFDVRKLCQGSSIIDILVYIETEIKGRRVFLDFRENPIGETVDFSSLTSEAREYLENGGACFGLPIDRLLHINAPAVDFFLDKGVDLKTQPLEIALCVQHNNGGLDIDCWWQTNIAGLFSAGEAAASHGVYRPGGSALNAGQVGATRAAQYIAEKRTEPPVATEAFLGRIQASLDAILAPLKSGGDRPTTPEELYKKATERMSKAGGAIRSPEKIRSACEELKREIAGFSQAVTIAKTPRSFAYACRLFETLICQLVYLSAMLGYMEAGGKSRGSALYTDANGILPLANISELFRFTLDDGSLHGQVQIASYSHGDCEISWRPVRDIPQEDRFFENVWRGYRENKNVY